MGGGGGAVMVIRPRPLTGATPPPDAGADPKIHSFRKHVRNNVHTQILKTLKSVKISKHWMRKPPGCVQNLKIFMVGVSRPTFIHLPHFMVRNKYLGKFFSCHFSNLSICGSFLI